MYIRPKSYISVQARCSTVLFQPLERVKNGRFNMQTISQGATFDEKPRLNFELLISEVSSSLIHPFTETDSVVNSSLQKIIDFIGIDRAALFQEESPGSKTLVLTHLRIRPGCGPI